MAATAEIWSRRAEQARRVASTLRLDDAKRAGRYVRECDYRARCLARPYRARCCETCPLGRDEPC